jgi:hypothetical protein
LLPIVPNCFPRLIAADCAQLFLIVADCAQLFPSRSMMLQRVPNLCVMGGDAHAIVRSHLRPCSVSHVFINFPEPPSGYQVNPQPCNFPEPPSGYQAELRQIATDRPLIAPLIACDCPRTVRP